jgi:citrate synthase
VESPENWPAVIWYVVTALGVWFGKDVWGWLKAQMSDTREYEQKRQSERDTYERQHDEQLVQAFHSNALAMQQVSVAVESVSRSVDGVMDHLDGMAHRDSTIQNFLMTMRAEVHGELTTIEEQLTVIRQRQEQIGSELLAYAMGRTPTRRDDYTTLQLELESARAELQRQREFLTGEDEEVPRWNP